MFDWIADFFKALFDLIPKVIYLLYSSLACVLDVLQLFFRKLAGLDVYYVDGKAVAGDLVTNFIAGIIGINFDGNDVIEYSALTTVFWAFIIFGIIICFASTLIAVIKSHYSYDEKAAKGPMQYVYTALKSMVNIAAVPVIVVLALYVSQALLTAIDTITSVDSGTVVSMFGDKKDLLQSVDTDKTATGKDSDENKTYIYYDIFGYGGAIAYGNSTNFVEDIFLDGKTLANIGAKNQTFSGSLFKVAAYNANRARINNWSVDNAEITGLKGSNLELFANAGTKKDVDLADMIDTAFACNLHTKEYFKLNYTGPQSGIVSLKYFTNWLTMGDISFSKFNIGLVWYYYDLWNFNFIVGFGACIVCLSIFINIILGLITRLFMTIGLFLIAPPLFGLAPMDGGGAAKKWRENFVKQVLMTYGAVYGMNILFLLLPYINRIDFFNIAIADYFAQTLIIIAGLITIKALISTVSSIIGAEDANKAGEGIKEEVGSTMGKAAGMTLGAAKFATKFTPAAYAAKGLGALAGKGLGALKDQTIGRLTGSKGVADAEKAEKKAQAKYDDAVLKAGGDESAVPQYIKDQLSDAKKATKNAQNVREIKSNSRIVKTGKKVGGFAKDLASSAITQPFTMMGKAFGDDKFISGFAEKSGIKTKRKLDEETADNTKDIKKQNARMLNTMEELKKGIQDLNDKHP